MVSARRLTRIVVLVGLAGLTAGIHARLVALRDVATEDRGLVYVPAPEYLRPMSLGFREAVADLVWIRALIFTSTQANATTDIQRYTDAIVGLAPRFHEAYAWAGVLHVYSGSDIDRNAVDHAIAAYRRGLEQFPESHELLYPLGMLLLNHTQTTPGYAPEEKAAAREEGAEMIRRAAAFGADRLVRQYAATLLSKGGDKALARQYIQAQLAGLDEGEDRLRRNLEIRLAELGEGSSAQEVLSVGRSFRLEREQQFPYLPDAIYTVLRDPRAGTESERPTPP